MGAVLPRAYEHLLRELAPQVLGRVVRRYGDFSAAEDAVQEALLAAANQWQHEGVPDDPRAWLTTVAARRMADQLRAEIARRRREASLVVQALPEEWVAPALDSDAAEPERDDTLDLLFMCCHPALTRTSAIALTLRAVAGLSTAQIAHAFLVPEATMAQRISRSKQLIKKSGEGFGLPDETERATRLDAVLHVLYLIYNEGYASSTGDVLQHVDLAREGIRLVRLVRQRLPDDPELLGLLALMLLNDARRAARSGPDGELIPLDEQDRSLWDREQVAEGVLILERALGQGKPGVYQLQAAIAALHDEAPRSEDTDWPQISSLYGVLLEMTDNPMVRLNHAIAAAMVHGPRHGLTLLEPLDADPRLAQHHRLAAVRAHFYEKLGDVASALAHYRTAAERTASEVERNYLLLKAARLANRE